MNLSLCSKNLVQDALNPLNYKASLADPKILHFPTFLLQFSTRFVPIPYLICSLLRGTIIVQTPKRYMLVSSGEKAAELVWLVPNTRYQFRRNCLVLPFILLHIQCHRQVCHMLSDIVHRGAVGLIRRGILANGTKAMNRRLLIQ